MSVYVSPLTFSQMIADSPAELLRAAELLRVDVDFPVRLGPRLRPVAVTMGAIELSQREFVAKIEELTRNIP